MEEKIKQSDLGQQAQGESAVGQQAEMPAGENLPTSNSMPYNKTLFILMGLFVLSLIVCISYYLGMQSQKASDMVVNPYLKEISATPVVTQQAVTPTPDPTEGWLSFSNAKYGYSLKYPNTLTANEQSQYYYYAEFDLPVGANGSHSLPPFVVSVIPDTFIATDVAAYNYMSSDWINQFYIMKIGDNKTTTSGAVFIKLPNITVAGQDAVVVGVVATGIKQHRVYVKKGGYIYMFSNYYQTDSELANFQLFLSTVKFN